MSRARTRGLPALLGPAGSDAVPPPGQLEKESLTAFGEALRRLESGFADLPDAGSPPPDAVALERVLLETAERLRDNYPYFHPLYAGQMLKPPYPVARLAYSLALWINPNNHALDGGRASSAMEKEAVAGIARMFGWETPLGHLAGGGTMANLEALWVAGRLAPGKMVLASEQAHYTHGRISGVLGLGFEAVPCDRRGRMDVGALEARLSRGGVGSTAFSPTAAGACSSGIPPWAASTTTTRRTPTSARATCIWGRSASSVRDDRRAHGGERRRRPVAGGGRLQGRSAVPRAVPRGCRSRGASGQLEKAGW